LLGKQTLTDVKAAGLQVFNKLFLIELFNNIVHEVLEYGLVVLATNHLV
jgi:hypothetical protein